MGTSPRATVLLPVHGPASFVGEAIVSLQSQTYADWECLIALDDAEASATSLIRDAVGGDPRFRFLPQAEGLGAAANWNRGVDAATGEFLKVLCCDDVLYPSCLEAQVSVLDSFPNAALASGRRDVIDQTGRRVIAGWGTRRAVPVEPGPKAVRRFIRSGVNGIGEPSFVLMRQAALATVGGFSREWDFVIDMATYARLLSQADHARVAGTVGAFRVHDSAWSRTLVGGQSRETRRFIQSLARDPNLGATRLGAALGQVRSPVNTLARRAVYRVSDLSVRWGAGAVPSGTALAAREPAHKSGASVG